MNHIYNCSIRNLLKQAHRLRRCTGADRLSGMRGDERVQDGMFSYVSLEQRVPQDHPLRAIRKLTMRRCGR